MRFRRHGSPQPPLVPVPPPEREVEAFHAEALRLLDYQWRRADSFERKALGFLAANGVIATLLTPSLKTVLDLHGVYRIAALSLGAAVVVLLAGSAACSAGALWARGSQSVSVDQVRSFWKAYLDRVGTDDGRFDAVHTANLQRDLVEMLLHAREETTSPVQSLREDADRRGRWFVWGVRLNLAALLLILSVVVTTTLGSL